MRIGFQFSIASGFLNAAKEAKELKCETFQIFSKNPRGRGERKLEKEEIKNFKKFVSKNFGLNYFYLHTPYYINLASPDKGIFENSIKTVISDLERTEKLGGKFLITHLGSHKGKGLRFGLNQVIKALKRIFRKYKGKVKLILENTPGAGFEVGSKFEELSYILKRLSVISCKLLVCFDTCHAFVAGYDLRNEEKINKILKEFDKIIGLKYLKLIHLNDSKFDLNSKRDWHQDIGKGKIGLEGFKALFKNKKLKNLDFILETPRKDEKDDLRNLKVVKKIIEGEI